MKNTSFSYTNGSKCPQVSQRNSAFCHHKHSWKYPQVSIKISSGVTLTGSLFGSLVGSNNTTTIPFTNQHITCCSSCQDESGV